MTDPSNVPVPPDDLPKTCRHRVYRGMAIMWGINFIHLGLAAILMKFGTTLGDGLMFAYPALALLYGSVVAFLFRTDKALARGMVIALCTTVLLSCGCWVYVANHLTF